MSGRNPRGVPDTRFETNLIPPRNGFERSFNARTSLANQGNGGKHTGMMTRCAMCGVPMRRPPSRLIRAENPCCSKACSYRIRTVRIEILCVVCNKPFLIAPHNITRKVTCSKECQSLRKCKNRESPNISALAGHRKALRAICKEGKCLNCGITKGPWRVRGMHTTYADGVTTVDTSNAKLFCMKCHLTDIAPLGYLGWQKNSPGWRCKERAFDCAKDALNEEMKK